MEQSKQTQPNQTRGLILAVVSVLCFSATSVLLSHLNSAHSIDGWVASAYRAVVGLIVILAMQGSTGKLNLSHIFTNRLLFARGLIGGATIPLYYVCIMEIGPGRAGMLGGSYPLFAAIFAMVLLKEGLKLSYFFYFTIAFVGLVAVFSSNGIEASNPTYDSLSIVGAAAAGICVVLIRHLRHTENTSTIFASQCVFTLIIAAIAAGDRLILSDPTALGLTMLAAITVVGGQLSITESFRHINVAKGSTLQMLTPALTILLSALLLGEHFSAQELIGGAAILFASYKIAMSKH
ncbi:MAG: DMT family transporter [Opitutaceae bacterium]